MTPRQRSLVRSFGYAWAGLVYIWRTQGNVRLHLAALILVVSLARWLGFDAVRLALVLLTAGAVVAVEALNTAVEAAVDLAADGPHPKARRAKDVAAAAVLWTAAVAVAVGLILFGPELGRVPAVLAERWREAPLTVGAVALAVGLLSAGGLRR